MFIVYAIGYNMIVDCELVVLLYVLCSVNAFVISTNVNSISVLTGTNFNKWKEHVVIMISCMDLDLAIQKEPHPALTDTSTIQQKVCYDS